MIQFLICWQIFLWGRDCTEWGRRWGCGWKPHVRGNITGQSPLRTGQQKHVQLDRSTNASDAWGSESLQCSWPICHLYDLKNENSKNYNSAKNLHLHLSSLFQDPPGLGIALTFCSCPVFFKNYFIYYDLSMFWYFFCNPLISSLLNVLGYEFPTYCTIVNYRLSVLGDLRHTCPSALLFLVQSGYTFLHRWGQKPSLGI